VIVAAEITSEANDKKQMLPMLEKVEGVVEKKPEGHLALLHRWNL
jgi:hypothetical protein